MSAKATLLTAIRDELKSAIPAVANRVVVVVQDAQGNQLLPITLECPFLAVSDGGMVVETAPGQVERQTYQARVRAYVQELRDAETPVLGDAATGSLGAAGLQDLVAAALQGNLLAARIAGVECAEVEAQPAIDTVADESWFAVVGDVLLRYDMSEAL